MTQKTNDILAKAILGREAVTAAEALEAMKREPACAYASVAALAGTPADSDEAATLRRHISVAVGPEDTLRRLLDDREADFAAFYPEQRNAAPSTANTIDAFLSRFSASSDPEAEAAAIEQMIFNPTPTNYAEAFEQEEAQKNAPGAHEPEPAPAPSAKAPEPQENRGDALTESFAKIMIKNGNYVKALEIIQTLSLNNPEKSIYFADQIRFLRKLIYNAKKL